MSTTPDHGPAGLSAQALVELFPFHLIVDQQLQIVQMGDLLGRAVQGMQQGSDLSEFIKLVKPRRPLTFETLQKNQRTLVIAEVLSSGMRLKGQIVDQGATLLLLASPQVQSVEQLAALGVQLDDLPPHDALLDYLLLMQAQTRALDEARELSTSLAEQRQALQISEQKLQLLLRDQQRQLEELSSPLVPITREIVIMPLIGSVNAERSQQVLEALLAGVAEMKPRWVIMDITGMRVVDETIGNTIVQAARATQLLGSTLIITGIRPEVAQSIISLGMGLEELRTYGSLQQAVLTLLGTAL